MSIDKINNFFTVNSKLKQMLYRMCPPQEGSLFDEEDIIKYVDVMYNDIDFVYGLLEDIARDFLPFDDLISKISLLKQRALDELLSCGTDIIKLRNFYQTFFSDMKVSFLNSVKKECVGYTLFDIPSGAIEEAFTVNEFLHLFHSFILNSNSIYETANVNKVKENKNHDAIRLLGVDCKLGIDVYNLFTFDLDVGLTDILAVNENKVIAMIRDLGHALTMEISKKGDSYRIEYFIPKICNLEMVNKLPGVNKVKDINFGTTGVFETDDLNSLFSFISSVPTDLDMILSI